MGKGDKRTKRGKIFKSSYGKTRPHKPGKKQESTAGRARTPQRAPGSSR